VTGEVILGDLSKSGFEVTQDHEDSDAIVINTCAFVQDAKSESIEAIMVSEEYGALVSICELVVGRLLCAGQEEHRFCFVLYV
jgi:tRNA A37 methylthiotransferase MiaB